MKKCAKCDVVLGCFMMRKALVSGGCKDFQKATKKYYDAAREIIKSITKWKKRTKLIGAPFTKILRAKYREQQRRPDAAV
jgi:hypothetical protein